MSTAVVPVVTRARELDERTLQSGECVRKSGVSPQHTPATKIWFGRVANEPGHRSPPHHHEECETGGYVLQGHGRIYFGEDYKEYTDMYPGMAKTARDESFDEIADWFETLAKAERSHANRFQKALDNLED